MKSLLFALGLALCCAVLAERFENFDHSKINRNQYVTAMASDCPKLKKMLPHMKAAPIAFEQMSADKIKMTIDMSTHKGCKTVNPILKRKNGVFTTACGKGGEKTVKEIEMNEVSMYISLTLSHKEGQCTIASLAVTNLNNTQVALDGFRNFINRDGLETEEIQVLSTEGMCPRST